MEFYPPRKFEHFVKTGEDSVFFENTSHACNSTTTIVGLIISSICTCHFSTRYWNLKFLSYLIEGSYDNQDDDNNSNDNPIDIISNYFRLVYLFFLRFISIFNSDTILNIIFYVFSCRLKFILVETG